MNKDILDKIMPPTGDRISSMQDNVLASLLSNGRLQRMIGSNNRDPQAYRIDEYLDDLRKAIWTELPGHQAIDNYRRNLQKSFVERLGNIVSPAASPISSGGGIIITIGPITDPKKTDIISVAKGTLRTLRAEISSALPGYSDKMSRYHLQDVLERIDKVLNPK